MRTRNRTRKRRCSGTRAGNFSFSRELENRTRRLRCAAQRQDSSRMTHSSASFLVETWRCESRFRFVGARALKTRRRDTYIYSTLGEFVMRCGRFFCNKKGLVIILVDPYSHKIHTLVHTHTHAHIKITTLR